MPTAPSTTNASWPPTYAGCAMAAPLAVSAPRRVRRQKNDDLLFRTSGERIQREDEGKPKAASSPARLSKMSGSVLAGARSGTTPTKSDLTTS
eukprot:6780648-Pyramimonas_sp.AAC.1